MKLDTAAFDAAFANPDNEDAARVFANCPTKHAERDYDAEYPFDSDEPWAWRAKCKGCGAWIIHGSKEFWADKAKAREFYERSCK